MHRLDSRSSWFLLGLSIICSSAANAQTVSAHLVDLYASQLNSCDRITSNFKGKDLELNGMKKEYVVLLHGIARTKRSMNVLEKELLKEGYHVLNIDYPSRKNSISEIAPIIFKEIKNLSQESNGKLHFVAYSMGCLIVRELLAKYPLTNIGNIVMLAPPNQGSEVADFLKNNLLYKHFYGPAGNELTTNTARNNPFPKMQHPFGVIAGNLCLDPISYFILPQGNDGKVTIENTKLEGMSDHIVLPCSHTFIMRNKAVINQVKYFLRNSEFKRQK